MLPSMQFALLPQDGFLVVQLAGLVSLEAWEKVLRELEVAISTEQNDLMVGDLSGLVGWLGVPERQAVGGLMATHLARMRKVALVIEARKITGVVEAQAQQDGLNLRLFSSHEDAVEWVLS
jgi:hypothetical protein